jgi:trigger factor
LGDPKKLKVKKTTTKITQKNIDEVIERLRTGAATKTAVKRAAAAGDEVIIDFTGLRDGQEFDGGKAKDFPLQLGSNSFIPGFEDAIVGHKTGDKFDIPLTFPKDYHAKALAGQKVVFKIDLKKVSEVKPPVLDDKFAATVGPFKTVAELEQDIRRELEQRAAAETQAKYQQDLLDALVAKSDVEAPDVLVQEQLQAIERDFTQNLTYRGLDLERYLEGEGYKDRADWEAKELRPSAEQRVRRSLVLSELSRQQNITASDAEIDARQAKIVEQYNDPKLRAEFESDGVRRDIANQIITEKTLARLAELAA